VAAGIGFAAVGDLRKMGVVSCGSQYLEMRTFGPGQPPLQC
jgi:hypothetical protein